MSKVNIKYTPMAKIMESYIAYEKRKELEAIQKQEEDNYKIYKESLEMERIANIGADIKKAKDDYYEFKSVLTKSLLDNAINKIFIPAIPIEQNIVQPDSITFAESYTASKGVKKVLNEFKRSTPLLSSIALIIENTESEIMSKVKKGDPSTYNVDPEDLVKFNKALDDESIRDMSDIIKTRVQVEIDDFIKKNKADKAKHIEIIERSKEKIEKVDNEDIAESIMNETTRKVNAIYNSRSFSIFEGMVRKISESSYIDENLRNNMIKENGSLDMDSVMEKAIVMYTFLETLNTTRMENVDEEYLKELYVNL